MIDGTSNFFVTPIFCSIKGFRPADNNDDYYYINPGFKFEIYQNDNYGGSFVSLDNDGDTPIVKATTNVNQVGSIKVFYRNSLNESHSEIKMDFIS
jgi:hypothetical protein